VVDGWLGGVRVVLSMWILAFGHDGGARLAGIVMIPGTGLAELASFFGEPQAVHSHWLRPLESSQS
jgi:hypothetical protein